MKYYAISLSVESQLPKLRQTLQKVGFTKLEVDDIIECFRVGFIHDMHIVNFLTKPPQKNKLTFIGDKAKELLLFELAIQFYDLAKNDTKIISTCIILLKMADARYAFFAVHMLNDLLARDVNFSPVTLKTLKEIYNKFPQNNIAMKNAKEALGDLIDYIPVV